MAAQPTVMPCWFCMWAAMASPMTVLPLPVGLSTRIELMTGSGSPLRSRAVPVKRLTARWTIRAW